MNNKLNNLNNTMQRLDKAYGLLEEIFVRKGDVERMASAKIEINKAFFELQELAKQELAKQELAKQQLTKQEGEDGSVD